MGFAAGALLRRFFSLSEWLVAFPPLLALSGLASSPSSSCWHSFRTTQNQPLLSILSLGLSHRMSITSDIVNATETEERQYHRAVSEKIVQQLKDVHQNVVSRHGEMIEIKQQLQEHSRDLDHVDKANLRQAADMASRVGEHAIERRRKLEKLLDSPYFGRIDCTGEESDGAQPIYIGVHSFADGDQQQVIHDWRAPISSMFYDFELGDAHYEAPSGKIESHISLKRQFRIEKRQFRFMLESSLNIQDDILQEELSRASDNKLKTIVATIQRDQNTIIRNDHAHTLVIQGAAGSGKTSIALHRIAYLLYKHKDTISSDDLLIVSPNKVFAHYISQVLPELGEEMIRETTMESLAEELLEGKINFQTFGQQITVLLRNRDESYAERVRFKASTEFLDLLDGYIHHVRSTNLQASEIKVGFIKVDSNFVRQLFRKRSQLPINEQLNGVVNAVVEHLQLEHQKSVVGEDRAQLRASLKAMMGDTDIKAIYKKFYTWIERPEMLKMGAKATFEYADVFPLVYLKLAIDTTPANTAIKHVIVDEMQDYTPLQYRVLAHLYPCKKTILGDRNQSVNPLSSSSAESIRDVLPGTECVTMNKSYRSTYQITQLAQTIVHNPDLMPIERHGEPPQILGFRSKREELKFLEQQVGGFADTEFNTLAIICKNQSDADKLYEALGSRPDVRLIDAESKVFSSGVIISTAYLAKGLEFDQVLVPFCTAKEYQTSIDRHMLYVAVTRAMHSLTISYTGEKSPFLATSGDSSVKRHVS